MNEAVIMADPIVEAGKHYVLAIDPVTGEEVKVELTPIGEFSQEKEDDAEVAVTIHYLDVPF